MRALAIAAQLIGVSLVLLGVSDLGAGSQSNALITILIGVLLVLGPSGWLRRLADRIPGVKGPEAMGLVVAGILALFGALIGYAIREDKPVLSAYHATAGSLASFEAPAEAYFPGKALAIHITSEWGPTTEAVDWVITNALPAERRAGGLNDADTFIVVKWEETTGPDGRHRSVDIEIIDARRRVIAGHTTIPGSGGAWPPEDQVIKYLSSLPAHPKP